MLLEQQNVRVLAIGQEAEVLQIPACTEEAFQQEVQLVLGDWRRWHYASCSPYCIRKRNPYTGY